MLRHALSYISLQPQAAEAQGILFFTVMCNITPVFGQWQRSGCVNDSSCWQGSFDACLVASEYAGHRRGWRKCPGTHSIVADMSKTMRWRS